MKKLKVFVLSVVLCGVAVSHSTAQVPITSDTSDPEIAKSIARSQKSAHAAIEKFAKKGDFEAFKNATYKEPFEDGGYIVDGDVYIPDDDALLVFYTRAVLAETSNPLKFIIARRYDGYDDIWSASQKRSLTYCVSTAFAGNHGMVVQAVEAATRAWEMAGDIDFIYLPAYDDTCTASNTNVTFDIRPVNVSGEYYARAFFPSYRRSNRNVLIDATGLVLPADSATALSLTGVLRHELGHTLGARHEHTRPESGACFEDTDWTVVTNYDAFSVMHYPHCNGKADTTLQLTAGDRNGVACIYGAAKGFIIDGAICRPRRAGPMNSHTAF